MIAEPPAEVVFVVLPFSQLGPALDASTLATMLCELGVSSKVEYLNEQFAKLAGERFYSFAAAGCSLNSLLGDWVFRDTAFGPMDDRAYLESLLMRDYIQPKDIPLAIRAKRHANDFLEGSLFGQTWSNAKVVCFWETFAKRDAVAGQLMSSLGMAKLLKAQYPGLVTVFGGHSTEGEMGEGYRALEIFDKIIDGRDLARAADEIIGCVSGKARGDVPGSDSNTARLNYGEIQSGKHRQLKYPIPNFDDYFKQAVGPINKRDTAIPMQASVGCWWAERSHCVFCGLPGLKTKFASKSAMDLLEEFRIQKSRYSPRTFEMNDLIVDHAYFETVFPRLATIVGDSEVFFETKSYLREREIEILSAAGINRIQAGIESLSAGTLSAMSKGVSVDQNIDFLKQSAKHEVRVYWNYLHSFPTESASDIDDAVKVIPELYDLEPPTTFQPVRVERFSPFYNSPKAHGIRSIKPDKSYEHIYANTSVDIDQVAFFFEHTDEFDSGPAKKTALNNLARSVAAWRMYAAQRNLQPLK